MEIGRLTDRKIKQYYEAAQKGSKFPMPYIRYMENGHMMQEGHHRAQVAKMLQIPQIPVLLINEEWKSTNTEFDAHYEEMMQIIWDYVDDLDMDDINSIFWRVLDFDDNFNKNAEEWWKDAVQYSVDVGSAYKESPFIIHKNNVLFIVKQTNLNEEYQQYIQSHNIQEDSLNVDQWIKLMTDLEMEGSFVIRIGQNWSKFIQYLRDKNLINANGSPTHAIYNMPSQDRHAIFNSPEDMADMICERIKKDDNMIKQIVEKAQLYKQYKSNARNPEITEADQMKLQKNYEAIKL